MGTGRNTIVFGSGLSGMVAAFISARALEDNASHNEDWQARSAFRSRIRDWRARHPVRRYPNAAGPPLPPSPLTLFQKDSHGLR
jgi:hypothetical protein